MKSISECINVSNMYYRYLNNKSIAFNELGLPRVPRKCFLNKWPKDIVPVNVMNSSSIKNKSKKLICFYCKDRYIYPRFDKLFTEIPKYRQYMGVIAPDITVTKDMDIEMQRFTILLNMLFMSILAVNDIKVVCNTRIGSPETLACFDVIPKDVMCASGTFGCKKSAQYDISYISKILRLNPSKLVIYGKRDDVMLSQLDMFGINYKRFNDYYTGQRLCRSKSVTYKYEYCIGENNGR